MLIDADWLVPKWRAPASVGGLMTSRSGGASTGRFASMNLGAWVGDDPQSVRSNMVSFAEATGARPVFMRQVHGTLVLNLDGLDDAVPLDGPLAAAHSGNVDSPWADATDELCRGAPEADACVSTRPGVACVVTVADCLPVLFAADNGRAVGAAHGGWRGLSSGVVERCLDAVCQAAGCEPKDVHAWLGACIGPGSYEVGADVLRAFDADPVSPDPLRFKPRRAADGSERWLANLPRLARDRLEAAGVHQVSGGEWCTVDDSRFYSFRRDRITGRMGAAVWLRG